MTLSLVKNTEVVNHPRSESGPGGARAALNEQEFKRMIAVERKRTERTHDPFLLMLLDGSNHQGSEKDEKILEKVMSALLSCTRDTDLVGWYDDHASVGVMYIGIGKDGKSSVLSAVLSKVSAALRNELTLEQFNEVSISFHFFPDEWDCDKSGRPNDQVLYPDIDNADNDRRAMMILKRAIDIVGSALIIILCIPLFAIIAAAIKMTSKGPVLFRQQRVGQYGQVFTFLKFRSMYVNNDDHVHKEYVAKLIANEAEQQTANDDGTGVYKLTNDKRVTPVGRLLRRSSLDELPQFLNVLKGEMSLVGPRPPIPYEFAIYQAWHRRRVLEVKPGITGLWQVTGRSKVKFDEMVRLDLRYATSWSPWLDIMILLRTPFAVIRGEGAM